MHPIGTCKPGGCLDGAQVVAGLDWAISHHYDIVSMSFGSPDGTYSEYLAIERAIAHGILVVAAAGNEAQSPPGDPNPYEYPAAYEHVLSVAASDADRRVGVVLELPADQRRVRARRRRLRRHRAGLRPHRRRQVHAHLRSAPGLAQPGWCEVDGTSFATPITAAAAAWVWSARRG